MRDGREATGLLRPNVHAATGLCALFLGVLPHPLEIVTAGLGVLTGWVLLPLSPLEPMLRRPGEPFIGGLRTYPLAVLGLVLLLPRAEAAAAWGVLAFGDSAAAVTGERIRSPSLFGHAKATWAGSLAYVVFGGVAAWGLSRGVVALGALGYVEEGVGTAPSLVLCFGAALAAAILDLVSLPPDDNVPAAVAAGGVLYTARVLL